MSARAFPLPNFSTSDDEYLFGAHALDSWDVLILQGRAVPGRAEIKSGQAELDVDEKKAKGSSGATLTMGGRKASRASVRITIWTAKQWNTFCDLSETLFHATSRRPTSSPLSVQFPPLLAVGISSVIVSGVGSPQRGSVNGTLTVDIDLIEYRASMGDQTMTAKRGAEPSIPSLDLDTQSVPGEGEFCVAPPASPTKTYSGPG